MPQRDFFRSPPTPWNSRRIVGAKVPFKPKHVWAIRQQLKSAGAVRDVALFDCAIDAKLRGCDLVKLRVSDVAPGGSVRQRVTVIQQKTGRPVPFEITDPTREALSTWLSLRGAKARCSVRRCRGGHRTVSASGPFADTAAMSGIGKGPGGNDRPATDPRSES
jgi:integrase